VTFAAGEALDECFFTDGFAEIMRPPLQGDATRPPWPPGSYDRGAYVVRFRLGVDDWRYEVQPLVWPGDPWDWGFDPDLTRNRRDVYDVYRQEVCQGGVIYGHARQRGAPPTGTISTSDSPHPGVLHTPFGAWLGLALTWQPWSETMADERFGLTAAYMVDYLGECYLVERGTKDGNSIGETRTWIAPRGGPLLS
jgi:hypothetical protein